MREETIAAISTALGSSGIGIVRVSGPEAIMVADRIFHSQSGKKLAACKSHTIHYGYIYENNRRIDEVLVMLMRGPHSYTTEDTVEINCHGGIYLVKKILSLVLENGARMAEPGEFTKRAFLGGRMDLSQAEAVMDVIRSDNQYALDASVRQLKGEVSEPIRKMRSTILYEIARIESALDDPEHISLEGYGDRLRVLLCEIMETIQKLIDSFDNGRRMKEGVRTAILGKPNVGKSSLLNLLAGEERAIVTEIAGTTRDILEESVSLDGIHLCLFDTAGIRETEDPIERIGVERAYRQGKDADLVLYVADAATGIDGQDREIYRSIQGKKTIVLLNKTDLKTGDENALNVLSRTVQKEWKPEAVILFSARNKTGLEELTEAIRSIFFEGKVFCSEEIHITSLRHWNLLKEAHKSLTLVQESIAQGMPEDFYSIDLMDAYEKLGLILGEEVEEDLVNEIFGKFCMGK